MSRVSHSKSLDLNMALYNEWVIIYSKSLDLNISNNWTLEISYLRIMMTTMTEGRSSPIAGHHPSSLDTVEWHTIPETNKPALPDIWKTSAGMNAAKDATERRSNGLRCNQYRVCALKWATMRPVQGLCAQMGYDATSTGFVRTYQCWGFMHQGWSQLVQHGVPDATRCLVALQHLDTRILVELSWIRVPQTNVKKATSPKDPDVFRVPGVRSLPNPTD